jgi:GT2 family glycosyltransferase
MRIPGEIRQRCVGAFSGVDALMPVPAISVVIPVFNKRDFVAASLESVAKAATRAGGVEIVIIDHCSTDGSYELACQYRDRAIVERISGGTISAVRNYGARMATGSLLVFIDSDCVVGDDYFETLRALASTTDAAALGCEYDIPAHPHWSERVWYDLHVVHEDGYRHFINAGNFAVQRAAFDAVSGFDERLVTGEDTDICARLRQAGYRIYESQRLRVVHLGNPKSSGAFFRKQVWHGLGGFSSVMLRRPNKATTMVVAHAVALVAAATTLVGALGLPWWWRLIVALGLVLAVPTVTVAYRYAETRRFVNLPGAVWLYTLFYLARVKALITVLLRPHGHRAAPAQPARQA